MYISEKLLRIRQDESLRRASMPRLIEQAAASSRSSGRTSRRLRLKRPAFGLGRAPRRA